MRYTLLERSKFKNTSSAVDGNQNIKISFCHPPSLTIKRRYNVILETIYNFPK